MKHFYVYILASQKNGTLYIGVTNDLERRMWEHKSKERKGFTEKYNVDKLVYLEEHESIIEREKQMKKWRRKWKLNLIEQDNPHWKDLDNW